MIVKNVLIAEKARASYMNTKSLPAFSMTIDIEISVWIVYVVRYRETGMR